MNNVVKPGVWWENKRPPEPPEPPPMDQRVAKLEALAERTDGRFEGPEQAAPLLDLYRRWIDAERLAMATSRIALAGPASALQGLQREAQALKSPACLQMAQLSLQTLIGKSAESILQFMGKEEVTGMLYQLVERPKLIPQFEREVANAVCE